MDKATLPPVTGWYPAEVEPARPGVYEVNYGGWSRTVFRTWTGRRWLLGGQTVADAHRLAKMNALALAAPWRGLSADPSLPVAAVRAVVAPAGQLNTLNLNFTFEFITDEQVERLNEARRNGHLERMLVAIAGGEPVSAEAVTQRAPASYESLLFNPAERVARIEPAPEVPRFVTESWAQAVERVPALAAYRAMAVTDPKASGALALLDTMPGYELFMVAGAGNHTAYIFRARGAA